MGVYDSIGDLRGVCEILYDNIVFMWNDSIIYKEENSSYVILTRKNGDIIRRVFDSIVTYDMGFVIGTRGGIWFACNKYGEELLNLGRHNPKWHKNILIKVDTDNESENIYRYEDGKLILVKEVKNSIASIVDSDDIEAIVIRNCVFNWESIINYKGDEILNDRSNLIVCEDGYVISYEFQARMGAVYKIVDGGKSVKMEMGYTEALLDTSDYPFVGLGFKKSMKIFRAANLIN